MRISDILDSMMATKITKNVNKRILNKYKNALNFNLDDTEPPLHQHLFFVGNLAWLEHQIKDDLEQFRNEEEQRLYQKTTTNEKILNILSEII
jgi:hypothetical protein